MVVEVNWTKQSLEDIENIASFIAYDSPHYSTIQTERFFEKVKVLETHPEFGRIVPEVGDPLIRQILEGNYRIIYKIKSESQIDVLTVYHQKRMFSI
jgi:addiction module RelE/StbE family toxin